MQYQLLPDLTDEEYQALKADIAERGVMVPVEMDEEGNILDGHHRVRACVELGRTDWPRTMRRGLTEQQKQEHVLALNLKRRHLSREQRAELVARLRGQGWSTRQIADKTGFPRSTVDRDLSQMGQVEPALVTGRDGKQYPAQRVERPILDPLPEDEDDSHSCGTCRYNDGSLRYESSAFWCRWAKQEWGYESDPLCKGEAWEPEEQAEDVAPPPTPPAVHPPTIEEIAGPVRPAMAVHFSNETAEHYTPRHILDAVEACLGAIDLDPCAESHDSPNVPAAQHFTREDDGLAQPWHGRVFMNPPYGSEIPAWVEKLCQEHEAGRTAAAMALLLVEWRQRKNQNETAATSQERGDEEC